MHLLLVQAHTFKLRKKTNKTNCTSFNIALLMFLSTLPRPSVKTLLVAWIIKTQRQILGFKLKIRKAKQSTTRETFYLYKIFIQTEGARSCLHEPSNFTFHWVPVSSPLYSSLCPATLFLSPAPNTSSIDLWYCGPQFPVLINHHLNARQLGTALASQNSLRLFHWINLEPFCSALFFLWKTQQRLMVFLRSCGSLTNPWVFQAAL